MHRAAFALSFLACTSIARRVRLSDARPQSSTLDDCQVWLEARLPHERPTLLQQLAAFLLAYRPTTAFISAARGPVQTRRHDLHACDGPVMTRRPRHRETLMLFSNVRAREEENGLDTEYPWRFDGRFWFRPALVRMPKEGAVPGGARPLGLFGWTLGGVVCLEYDESPVGPYFEYVTMGAVVTKGGTIGQWGSRLFVSTRVAEEVCQRVWDVPAEVARIDFQERPGQGLRVDAPPAVGCKTGDAEICVHGWAGTRTSQEGSEPTGGLPVLWTPSIKALWFPLVPFPAAEGSGMPLHRLRLSASSLRLHLCGQSSSDELGVPLPVGFSADGLRIEIAREDGAL